MNDYKKIIEENAEKFEDKDNLTDFIDNYISDNKELTDLEDDISEYADGLVPIYYYQIVKEWQENTGCHALTIEVCGEYAERDIYKMMSSDLFFFKEQKLRADYDKLIELIEENEEEN
jgi:hypothetical protein